MNCDNKSEHVTVDIEHLYSIIILFNEFSSPGSTIRTKTHYQTVTFNKTIPTIKISVPFAT